MFVIGFSVVGEADVETARPLKYPITYEHRLAIANIFG